jgi:hypothetical protein
LLNALPDLMFALMGMEIS